MDLHTLIVMGHVIGTILGTGGATLAEVQIDRALRDGRVSDDERALMHANYWMIRVGLAFIIVSALALVWYYLEDGARWVLTSHKIWAKEVMTVVIIVNAVLLTKRWVPLWLGASISFTSWWGATLLGLTERLPYTFVQYMTVYVGAIFVVAGVLHLLRKKVTGR